MRLPLLALIGPLAAVAAHAAPAVVSDNIVVDQFGYLPEARKVAVLADRQQGFNAPDAYLPGPQLEVRRWADDAVAFTGSPGAWRGGALHAQSGDRAWHFDFSALATPGSYYVWDAALGVGSGRFEIADDAAAGALDQALHSLYYQRCGVAKVAAHAGASWADGACHLGPLQDLDCRLVLNPAGTPGLDLSGGWHDAGDYNKYVNFADDPVHDLLLAYEQHPGAFTDAVGIPESGNGIPDVLDEARVELEWMLKMQVADGSVMHKVSVTDFSAASPPSADAGARRHSLPTASATISACGAFAHAAIVFGTLGDAPSQAFAQRLETAAIDAWNWLVANPGQVPSAYDNSGFNSAPAEDSGYDQLANRTCAAAYLLVLTGDTRYRDFFDASYTSVHLLQWGHAYPFEALYQDGLLYYGRSPIATRAVIGAIRQAFRDSMNGPSNLEHWTNGDDPYGAFLEDADYTWGSNRTKSAYGNMYRAMVEQDLDPARSPEHAAAAAGYLHYLHGVNALGLVFLTNMGGHGAERSATTLYHSWFADGTAWDQVGVSPLGPPPGILPGGVNPSYQPDAFYTGPPIEPPENQPVQKSYRDWNTSWPENSWEVTENQVAYQATFIRLLAAHVRRVAAPPLATTDPSDAVACAGGSASFAVTASGGTPPYSWQWQHDTLDVPGATTDTLAIAPVGAADAGSYACVVRDSGGASITSGSAQLTVNDLPASPGASLRVTRPGGTVTLAWNACAGAAGYAVLRCDASAGPCLPADAAAPPATSWTEPDPSLRVLWYSVAAANACGRTD